MTAASMYGVADFDREAKSRLVVIRRAEYFPELKTRVLYFFVHRPLSSLLGAVIGMACKRLHAKAEKIHDVASWFDGEYPAYFSAIAGESRVPSETFLQLAKSAKEQNLKLIKVCRANVSALRAHQQIRLAAAFDAVLAGAVGYDLVIGKFVEIGELAYSDKDLMRKSRKLSVEIDQHLANFYSEQDDSFDPAVIAAADAALERLKAPAK